MEAFVHTGDFDFNVFAQTPGPTIEPKPKVEKKRKEREGVPSWHNNVNGRSTKEERNLQGREQQEIQQNAPPSKRQHTGVANTKAQLHSTNQKGKSNSTDEATQTLKQTTSKHTHKNNTKQSDNKGHNTKQQSGQKMWDYDAKEVWEPDATDIANTINIDRGESMFLGDFSDTGLSKRLISTVTNNMSLLQPTVIQHYAIPQILEGHDALIKAETGSGKTLTYVLPVLNVLGDMNPHIKREDGAYAIILAPTRELVSQIFDVVTQVAKTWIWVVPGYLSGGENKSSEKNRLRKGVNVLVSTPGRLMDHLRTTHSFVFKHLRFLVLDEADRLLDMGLGPQVAEIVEFLKSKCGEPSQEQMGLSENRRTGTHPNKTTTSEKIDTPKEPEPKPKLNKTIKFEYNDGYVPKKEVVLEGKKFQTIMASATLHNGIRQLAFVALHKPVYIGLKPQTVSEFGAKKKRADIETGQTYNTPSQLQQFCALVRAKDRTSSLVSFLKSNIEENTKAIIFVASCASADFFYNVLRGATADIGVIQPKKRPGEKTVPLGSEKVIEHIPLVGAPAFRLHGDLTQVERNESTNKFRSAKSGVLIATDVAARGLDFPDLDWIVQFDPPSDTKDYIHRVGRTARMGRKGKSILYLTPEEKEYLTYLGNFGIKMENMALPGDITTQRLIEAYVRHNSHAYITAKTAYIAAVRAYATHTSATKHIFNVANLHVGHLAKAFCLHDKPSMLATTAKNEEAARAKEKEQRKKDKEASKVFKSAPKRMEKSEFEAGF